MKKYFILISLFWGASCSSQNTEVVNEVLGPDEFQAKLQESPTGILLDVRTPEEFGEGHLQNAVNIDFRNEGFRENLEGLDRTLPYYVYCRSGNRSGNTATMMKEMGFTEVYDLSGGITAWQELSLPVIKE